MLWSSNAAKIPRKNLKNTDQNVNWAVVQRARRKKSSAQSAT
jgi:hypothetical protein